MTTPPTYVANKLRALERVVRSLQMADADLEDYDTNLSGDIRACLYEAQKRIESFKYEWGIE